MDVQKSFELPLLVYDGECSMCERFAKSIHKFDSTSHINIHSFHDEDIFANFPMLNAEDCDKEVHLILEDQSVLRGARVVEYLVTLNPMIKKISWLVESDAGRKAIDIFYKSANIYRETLLNRCPKCKNK
ncbi:hypothetical protein A9Q84_18505 [Halobacteriovorax marinus]|uniref:Thiol-disulfide oxidoreductase n=1 Tax=Halobacteriovorax marinus TaxID=97084 RepID=A0A1Y5F1Z8_9BACT|nr:hypothetical protein A9Q84_18505 [Halobacteriovorax marinus]